VDLEKPKDLVGNSIVSDLGVDAEDEEFFLHRQASYDGQQWAGGR
jgi:hypothetical protein